MKNRTAEEIRSAVFGAAEMWEEDGALCFSKTSKEQTEASQQQAAAALREQENAEREARTEKSRQEQMLTEDYIREHPDSLMAKIYRQKKKKT